LPAFDAERSHRIYEMIFKPIEPVLRGVTQLIVVPDVPLDKVPFSILVTEQPPRDRTILTADFRRMNWIANRYSITKIRSVSELHTLRGEVRESTTTRPFIGFGDPRLKPGGSLPTLPSLPGTADELLDIAASLGAGKDDVFLRERATKANVHKADLSTFRVIVFATHSLGAGGLANLTEPALLLTPNGDDDGLLTASDIASLKVNAELVILSTSDAENFPSTTSLLTLDDAFLVAGARAVMVSQLPLSSAAAETLTVRTVAEKELDPALGWSEALRRSMLEMLGDPNHPEFAHPVFWGGFEISTGT
jgi:CHAT domain-containing protein